jgi:excisionase family DNA binding protein
MRPLLLTVRATAEALSLGTTSIYKLLGQGRLQSIVVGRRRLITADSVRELVEASDPALAVLAARQPDRRKSDR